MKTLLTLCLLWCIAPALLPAQPSVDLLSIRQDNHLPTDYDDPLAAGAEQRSLRQYDVRLLVPPEIGQHGDRLLLGGQYMNFEFRSHAGDEIMQRAHFQWLEVHLGYLKHWHKAKRDQSTQLFVFPKWSTDGKLFTSDAFQYGASLLHTVQINDRLRVGGGLYAFNEAFGWYFSPLISVDWRLANDWYVYGTLLGSMQVSKVLGDQFEVGFSFWGPGNSIFATEHPGEYVRIVKDLYSLWRLEGTWYFSGFSFAGSEANPYLRLSAGYTLDRRLDLYDANDEILNTGIFYPYQNGLVLSVTLAVRVKG